MICCVQHFTQETAYFMGKGPTHFTEIGLGALVLTLEVTSGQSYLCEETT